MKASDSRHQHPNTAESRAILDALPAIAWCKLPDGSNEFVNQRWQNYTGIPEDEARGLGWQAAVHPDDLPKLTEKWAEIVASGKGGEFEGRLRRRDGVFRWFLARFEPVRDDAGEIVRWYGSRRSGPRRRPGCSFPRKLRVQRHQRSQLLALHY